MKKIDPILIPELNRLAENQRVKTNITPAGDLVMSDFSYKKGHDIPEGYYFRFLPSLFLSHYTNTESEVTRSPYLLKKFRFS